MQVIVTGIVFMIVIVQLILIIIVMMIVILTATVIEIMVLIAIVIKHLIAIVMDFARTCLTCAWKSKKYGATIRYLMASQPESQKGPSS